MRARTRASAIAALVGIVLGATLVAGAGSSWTGALLEKRDGGTDALLGGCSYSNGTSGWSCVSPGNIPSGVSGWEIINGTNYSFETVPLPIGHWNSSSVANATFRNVSFAYWYSSFSPGGGLISVIGTEPTGASYNLSLTDGQLRSSQPWCTSTSGDARFGAQWGPTPGLRLMAI